MTRSDCYDGVWFCHIPPMNVMHFLLILVSTGASKSKGVRRKVFVCFCVRGFIVFFVIVCGRECIDL